MRIRAFQYVILVLFAAVVLGACTLGTSSTTAEDTPANAAAQKQGDTTKTGTIRKQGTLYTIETAPGQYETIDSLAVDLAAYENQSVKITGQYSGDTLFVGKVE